MTGWFYFAYAAIRKVNAVFVTLACTMIALMAIFTLWEVITRYFFRQPAMWTYPIVSYMLLYSIYLGVAYALQRGRHVSVDFIVEMVPERPRRAMERLAHLLGLTFSVVFVYQCWRLFARQAHEGQRDISALSLPLAPVSLVLVAGMGLTVLTYLFIVLDSWLTPASALTVQDQQGAHISTAELLEIE